MPISYWLSDELIEVFSTSEPLSEYVRGIQGIITGDNNAFLRYWPEVSKRTSVTPPDSFDSRNKDVSYWVPYTKGGDFRKWYGNNEFLLFWKDEGKQLTRRRSENAELYFRPCITWNKISTRGFSARLLPSGYVWDVAGSSMFPNKECQAHLLIALMCSSVAGHVLAAVSPTLNFEMETILAFPFIKKLEDIHVAVIENATNIVRCSRSDWDAYEISRDFMTLPLLDPICRFATLAETYAQLRSHWRSMTKETFRLEAENNRIFIDAYGLQNELTPEVPLDEITLTCNPAYRYGTKRTESEIEDLLRADTMRELISYAVGCMFGRYSLDVPGLILANQGDGIAEYLAKVPNPSFTPVADNVIPMLDGDWFGDDITERFRTFLRMTLGEDHFLTNLNFIESALGKDLRKYFTRDFFNDHIKHYKKRPIYWLFASPKGTFQALIYQHRYRPDTVSVVLNNYLRELRNKLEAYRRGQEALSISADASQGQKTKALKEIDTVAKQIQELDTWERTVLFPLATQRIEIDLDDGVKVNYPKFGAALKPIKGLNDAED
jgi:hypothetical protein